MSWSRRKRPFRPLWMNRRRFQRITKRILRGLRNRPPHTGKKSNSRTRRYSRLPLRRSPNGQKRKRRSEKRRKKAVRRRRAGKRRKKRRKRASLPARRSRKVKKNRKRRQTPPLPVPHPLLPAAIPKVWRLPIMPVSLWEILMCPEVPA